MTFEEFMAQKYAKAAEYSSGVTREQEDIAREAWETATLAEREACADLCSEEATLRGREGDKVSCSVAKALEEAIRARGNDGQKND
jgi:hypothetical protein